MVESRGQSAIECPRLERGDVGGSSRARWLAPALLLALLLQLFRRRKTRDGREGLARMAEQVEDAYQRAARAVMRANRRSAVRFPARLGTTPSDVPSFDPASLPARAGGWRLARPLPVPLCGALAVVRGGHLYAFSAGQPAYSAAVDQAGELGEWRNVSGDMPRTTTGTAFCAGRQRVYVAPASAHRGGTPVFSAPFLPGGRLGPWRLEAGLPVGLSHAAMAAGDTGIVLAGGRDCKGPSARVYTAQLIDGGCLQRWRGAPSLPAPLVGHALAFTENGILVLGGRTPEGRARAEVLRADWRGGEISAWQTVSALPGSRAGAGVVAHQGSVLVLGGENRVPHDDVLLGRNDSQLSEWQSASHGLPEPLSSVAAALSEHFLFVLGGVDRARRTETATRVLVLALASSPS